MWRYLKLTGWGLLGALYLPVMAIVLLPVVILTGDLSAFTSIAEFIGKDIS
jgi:hypothetical protein